MPQCQGCGGHITNDFVRVFGVDGEVQNCPDCSTFNEISGEDTL